ncbi:MAG: hypothetical protein IPK19_31390 [Chloroflexi bacterium]|nr:hypothetical protein [Chloroflexota bacterium]
MPGNSWSRAKRALPRKQLGDIWLGAGAEYVYSIPADVLFGLLALDKTEHERIAELVALSTARAARDRQQSETEQSKPQYLTPIHYKPSLWDRVLDFLGL